MRVNKPALHDWLLRRWYGKRPVVWLIPLTVLFVFLTGLRRWAYAHGLLPTVRLPVPVIVVGNITVGGTGKTPFVIWLSEALRARGYHPGIVTRGYGGRARQWPVGVTAASDPAQVGDEALLLARRSGLAVAAGPDRAAAARLLLNTGVDVVVSDDGLQHYRLGRNVEIIMLDRARGLGSRWRLPAGPLRETPRRLAAADLVIAKGGSGLSVAEAVNAVPMDLRPEAVVNLNDGRSVSLASFAGRHVHAVAGIGNPQQFFALLKAHGLDVDEHAWPDHVALSAADLDFGDDWPVLMTEKDAIKCPVSGLQNCWYLKVSASFAEDDAARILARVTSCLSTVADSAISR